MLKKKVASLFPAILLGICSIVAVADDTGREETSKEIMDYSSAASAEIVSYSVVTPASHTDVLGTESDHVADQYRSVEAKTRKVSDGVYEIFNEKGQVIATYETVPKGDVSQAKVS